MLNKAIAANLYSKIIKIYGNYSIINILLNYYIFIIILNYLKHCYCTNL